MNPLDNDVMYEILEQAIGQTNLMKWKILFPLCKQLRLEVTIKRILFIPVTCADPDECELPLKLIRGVLIKNNNLYILCKSGLLYTVSLEDRSWSLIFPMDSFSDKEMFQWRCKDWFVRIRRLLFRRKR